MFTGIIKELGRVRSFSGLGNVYKLSVESRIVSKSAVTGDSVAVNGVCLTLTGKDKDVMHFDVMGETAKRTNISKLKYGDVVNLENALKAGDSLSGHFVTGHIDCLGRIREMGRAGADHAIEVSFPEEYQKLVVEKGSVSLDGISLTVGRAGSGTLTVYIIPHTLKMTALSSRRAGDAVNIEFDIIGKYAVNLSAFAINT